MAPRPPCFLLLALLALTPAALAQRATGAGALPGTSADISRRTFEDGGLEPIVSTWLRPERLASSAAAEAARPGSLDLSAAQLLSVNEDPEGDMPRDLAFLPDGSAVLVVNRDTDTVTVFDLASASITHTVDVGDFPLHLAVAPDGSVAVVANALGDTLSVLDLSPLPGGAPVVVATVPVSGSQPYRVAVTSDSSRAVVGLINDGVASSFSIIDLGTRSETLSFPTAPQGVFGSFFTPESGIFGDITTQFALTPDGARIVLPDRGGSRVVIYAVATGALVADLPTAAAPTSVDVSADGSLAVVGHEFGTNRLSTIDLLAVPPVVTHSFTTGDLQNQVIRVTPDKSHALGVLSNEVVFVNLSTGATTATLFTGIVGDIELSFDGQYAFATNQSSAIISLASQTIVKTLPLAPTAECAASPVAHRVVGLNNRFREDCHLYDSNGAAGAVLGLASSGEPDEGDAPRTLAVAPDGLTAVVADNISRNVALLDLPTRSVRGYAQAGDRPLGIAVSPDGTTAVVCNGDADTVSVIDLASGSRVANLAVASRPAEVAIAPDSSQAYVTSVAGTDRVHFIQLAGAASSVTGSLVAGQMGSVVATYNVFSGLAVSPDGSVVAVCISFDDQLLLIDGQSHAQIKKVTVGDFPVRVAFSPDGGTAWVLNAFGNSVSVVNVAGAASAVTATVPSITFPLTVAVDAAGDFVYVGNFDGGNPKLHVIDATTNTKVAAVDLPGPARAAHLSPLDGRWYAAATGGQLVAVAADGAASALLEATPLSGDPSDFLYSESLRLAGAAQPGPDDAIDLADANLAAWVDLGSALAGTHGEPVLVGAGPLQAGTPVQLTLANALAGSSYALVIGLSFLGAPFKGGTMVPDADVVFFGIPVLASASGAAGWSQLGSTWPPGVPPAFSVWMQAWVTDPAGPKGFAASNGLRATTP